MSSPEFLTSDEAIKVDAALLSFKEKFSTRLAIYALRCLKQIAQEKAIPISAITPEQIQIWIKSDQTVQDQFAVDASFEDFFTRLVLSALKPLQQTSQQESLPIEQLTIDQVIAWFEQQARAARESNSERMS
ncbi:MAG: hypothetical protein HC835_19060 [Oscillatoriales cyanobacterium RM2_1_1]|nr:hypothetical protein [Oscillatoriales cyanobacterium SM2_3_0]NJO47531.1 hypothetical protein [Oscillatoriales cyanobacterium RM2_1_1]